MNLLIDAGYLLAAVAISPMVLYRMIRQKRYRKGWGHRLGNITRKSPGKKCVWIHAVSVGEVNATKTVVAELQKQLPDFEIVISTTTDTGFAQANKLYGDKLTIFYFPLDFSATMSRAFDNIKPDMILLVELEVWPNLADIAFKRNIPVAVINGRISERSFSRYKLLGGPIKKMFAKVSLILAQSEEYAERFRQVGTAQEKVIVTGSLKYDTAQMTDKIAGTDELAEQLNLSKKNKLWVAGATGNDEETLILDVYKKLKEQFGDLRLAIVPRKPERFNEVANLIKQHGFELSRYSELKSGAAKSEIENVILGDTMGDLRKFYSLADVIFVGRTLVPMGGSDMMEAAALGKTTIFGPHAFNFRQTVDALLGGNGAIQVQNSDELLEAMAKCLTDNDYAKKIAQAGQKVIRENQGATQRTVKQIIANKLVF